ncbi:hypothetical protein SBV1_2220023 [Verrucomicrobia bacterium]|nr:hypothetical protein SBV1_2220023 [Verrucomicrobiota bacterium]
MASKSIQVALPDELNGFVAREVKAGRYQNEGEVICEALRRLEAETANEVRRFEKAFGGGYERAETEEDVQRVESAVRAGRKR